MEKKVDKRLAEAVQKGYAKKQAKVRKQQDELQAKRDEHEKELKRALPKARAWVKEHLFEKIAEQEAMGSRTLVLDDYEDGVPTAAIARLINKIQGLTVWSQRDVIWEDSDYGKEYATQWYIQWTSADPNLNRNDR